MATELRFSKQIQKIALPDKDISIQDGELSKVSGWGTTKNPNESREKLRACSVPITNQKYCFKAYIGLGIKITDRMICAGYKEGGKDACNVRFIF